MLPRPRLLLLLCLLTLQWLLWTLPAHAAIDAYISRYLKVTDTVDLTQDAEGHQQTFSATDLSTGKQVFEANCLSCHVGGITLLEPNVSLSLADLRAATPRRDSIVGLVRFFRQPRTYDGRDSAISCREIPASWLPDPEVEKLAAFVLRSAEIAPGWGTAKL